MFFTGCSTVQKVPHKKVSPKSKTEILEMLSRHNMDVEWYSTTLSADIETSEEQFSSKIYLRIKKDSAIWMVVKKFSVEMIRMLSTPKETILLNRWDASWSKMSKSDLQNMGLPFDFIDMSHFLIGNVILPDTNQIDLSIKDNSYLIQCRDADIAMTYILDGDGLLTKSIYTIGKDRIESVYQDYRKLNNDKKYPHRRVINAYSGSTKALTIYAKAKKVEINIPKKMKFSIPSHYERHY